MGEELPQSPNTGNVRLYLNQGTNSAPSFVNYSVVYAGSNQLYKYRINPVVYDLDVDGLKDLIVGNDDGRVYFYKNVGTNATPVFNAMYDTLRTQNGMAIDVDIGSRIHFIDWRGDGDLDLLIGGSNGYVQVYENTASTGVEEGEKQAISVDGPDITPNPITETVLFSYSLQAAAHVRIDVYSVDGRLVATPINQFESGGQHQFVWDTNDTQGRTLPAGIYLVRLTADSEASTRNIVIMR
ncbi:T9SS type A sorting domain-containing protein [candidate division WOR-3 bacterium]|nr:T9SS type A sorting domain-containing protein [candidate division WOR-3 bacterium]